MNWPQYRYFRTRRNYAFACATELAAPLLRVYAAGKIREGEKPSPPVTWRKALLLGANHIGDLLYRTSSLPALKAALPECEFDMIAPAPACEVLEDNPTLRRVHRFEAPLSGSGDDFELLRKERYDAALCYDGGMGWRHLRLALNLGIPNRVAYTQKGFSAWVTHPISLRFPQPYPAYFRDFVAQLTGVNAAWDLRPQVFTGPEEERAAAAFWAELQLGVKPVLACFVTTRQPTGVWPMAKFAATLRVLIDQNAGEVVLCGAPGDAEKLNDLNATLGHRCKINAGRLPLRALVAFLRRCQAVLSTDSGPRHLANAAGVPVFFMRNLRSRQIETGAYLDTEYDFISDAECLPPAEQAAILDRVQPEEVAARITAQLTGSRF